MCIPSYRLSIEDAMWFWKRQ